VFLLLIDTPLPRAAVESCDDDARAIIARVDWEKNELEKKEEEEGKFFEKM